MAKARDIFDGITDPVNLVEAAYAAARGKYKRENVIAFMRDLMDNTAILRQRLDSGCWQPAPYREFAIRHPKPRTISAAPFADRVVHHALCRVILPVLEKTLVSQTCANRVGYGTHHAVDLCQRYLRRYDWYIKCDIRKFFPSIDHELLKGLVRRRIACPRTLVLVDSIIDSARQDGSLQSARRCGLPLGNLTSQHLANLFLSPLDHFVIQKLKVRGYVRYVDDFLVFGDTPESLNRMREEIVAFLARWRLLLHEERAHPRPEQDGITFLGYRVFRDRRRVTRDNVIRARRRIRFRYGQFQSGLLDVRRLKSSLFAWMGHAKNANAWRVARRILAGR